MNLEGVLLFVVGYFIVSFLVMWWEYSREFKVVYKLLFLGGLAPVLLVLAIIALVLFEGVCFAYDMFDFS